MIAALGVGGAYSSVESIYFNKIILILINRAHEKLTKSYIEVVSREFLENWDCLNYFREKKYFFARRAKLKRRNVAETWLCRKLLNIENICKSITKMWTLLKNIFLKKCFNILKIDWWTSTISLVNSNSFLSKSMWFLWIAHLKGVKNPVEPSTTTGSYLVSTLSPILNCFLVK